MFTPLLTTKLYIPPARSELVPRPRLIERLDDGLCLDRKLTLVSAPAGFGKTTLIAEWLVHAERPFAWLSLDEGDNDFTHPNKWHHRDSSHPPRGNKLTRACSCGTIYAL